MSNPIQGRMGSISGSSLVAQRPVEAGSNNFDALRLVLALMVVVSHLGYLSKIPVLWWTQLISSTLAVQGFFVVSGFLVTMSYENSSSLKSYALKRIRRIAPAYIVVVVGAAVLLSLISTLSPLEYFSNARFWKYLGFNLILANFTAPSLPGVFQDNFETAVNGSLWTIKIELAFYCLVPIIVMGVRRFGYQKVLWTMLVMSLCWKIGFGLAAEATGHEIFVRLAKQIPGQLSFFAGGAWAYYETRDNRRGSIWIAIGGCIAYFVASDLALELIAPVAVTAMVHWIAVGASRTLPVGKHGDFSYGIYLYHFPLIQVFIAAGVFTWSLGGGLLLISIFVLILAVLSWRLIEEPTLHRRGAAAPRLAGAGTGS